jgi:MFS transporter, ACS family, D-galactonate transporter
MSLVQDRTNTVFRREWVIVALLVASVLVNYVDRSNLAIAAPLLRHQLSLSPLQLGKLLAAFSWTYALLQLFGVSGWLADRFPVGYVLLTGYIVWSVATLATGLVSGFEALFLARLVLGAGESIAYPCYSRVFAELPQHHRGRANAFIDAGTKLGPSAGALIGGVLMIHFGWRALFLCLGLGGLLWIIPWLAVMPRTRAAPPQAAEVQPTTAELLRIRSAWGTFLGHFCGNYFYYFLLAWLPSYLVDDAKMSLGGMTRFTSVAFLLVAISTLSAGWLTDRLIAGGLSPTRVRKTAVAAGLACASLLGLVAVVPGTSRLSLAIVIVAATGFGAYASNHWAISQTLAGPAMAGRWTGLQNGVANLSGIVGPWLAGAIIQRYGSLRFAFAVTGVIALLGACSYALIVQRVEPVKWTSLPEAEP